MTLKVIGAGFGRTGTMSLKAALEQLGFGPCYHMVECMPRGPEHWRKWEQAVAGKNADWNGIFAGFGAAVDFPACGSYRQLADHYPDAKVVLTWRDPEQWFESTQRTIFAPHWVEHLRTQEMGRFVKTCMNDVFQDRMHDKEHLIRRFHEHAEEVRATIPASRLLEFEVSDGWTPLCEFLGVPVPGTPFPRCNDSAETREIIKQLMTGGSEGVFGNAVSQAG